MSENQIVNCHIEYSRPPRNRVGGLCRFEVSVLESAVDDLEQWWETTRPLIGHGFRVQRDLNEQVQRLVLDVAHNIASRKELSETDTNALISYGLEVCRPPRVNPL